MPLKLLELSSRLGNHNKQWMFSYTLVFVLQLSFSPTTPMNSHIRVLTLLIAMLLSCCGLAVVCGVIGYTHGMHTLSFMAAEVRFPVKCGIYCILHS